MSDVDLTGLIEKRNRKGTRYFEDAQGEIVAKECTKCSEIKELSRFSADKRRLAGKRSGCKDCALDQIRKFHEANPDYLRKYYEANADKLKERYRKYRENNKELYTAADLRRRARKRLLPDTFTESDLMEVTLYFEGGCSLTGDTDVHMDHVLPLTAGHGGTTYENMIPLRDDLNTSKNNRNLFEWFREEKERFELSQAKFDELVEYLADTNEMTTTEYEEYVRWCHDNPRTIEEIEADIERYGYKKPSSEIWREEVANKGRELVEA